MINIFSLLKADFLKIKRESVLKLHLIIPICGIILFLGYYSFSPQTTDKKLLIYLEAITIVLPTLISIVCSMIIEQEYFAGKFQNILALPTRLLPFLSKIILILFLGFISISISIIGFTLLYFGFNPPEPYGIEFYLNIVFIIFCSSISIYLIHFILGVRFGSSLTIGMGIIGTLVSALLITGLGDNKWYFIPYAWPTRLTEIYIYYVNNNFLEKSSSSGLAILFGIVETMLITLYIFLKLPKWEGRQSND